MARHPTAPGGNRVEKQGPIELPLHVSTARSPSAHVEAQIILTFVDGSVAHIDDAIAMIVKGKNARSARPILDFIFGDAHTEEGDVLVWSLVDGVSRPATVAVIHDHGAAFSVSLLFSDNARAATFRAVEQVEIIRV